MQSHVTSLGQLHISTSDLDRSIDFYCDKLGLPLLFRVPNQQMAFVQCGSTRLYLGTPEDDSFRSRPVIYLTVDDIDDAYRTISERGVQFIETPHVVHRDGDVELCMAFCRDPDGNAVSIMQERPAR